MATTITKFAFWLVTFAAAYFIKSTELISLATAFFALHATIVGLLLVSLLLTCAFGREAALKTYGSFLIRVLRFSVAILITSIFSFVATLLLEVDFCTAYMLTTLGQCMYNIDVVDESDFIKLKAKLKAKKNVKKAKVLNAPSSEKKKNVSQTIAEKKVQQNSGEKKPIIDAVQVQNDKVISEVEVEAETEPESMPETVQEVVPAEEEVHDTTVDLVLDNTFDTPFVVPPVQPEASLNPVPDIPVD